MSRLTAIGCVFAVAALTGCANTFGGVDVHHVSPSMIAVSQPANVRSAYTNGSRVCPEPPPDAALQAVANAAVKVSTKAGASLDVSGGLTTSVVQLAGRTQTVLIARDAFTANCILMMNGDIRPEDAEANYNATLGVITMIAKADQAAAEADATNARTEQAKVVLAASGSADPAVIKAVAKLTATVDTNVDTIIKALSNGQGVLLPALVTKFFGQSNVEDIITPPVARTLGKQTDPEVLRGLLDGSLYRYTEALSALARTFKG